MPLLLSAAGWGFVATLAGLLTGTPELRTGGAVGVCVFLLAAFLLDRYSVYRHIEEDPLGTADGDFNHIEFIFPERKDTAA